MLRVFLLKKLRLRRLLMMPLVIVLFVYHFFLAVYMHVVKITRKTVIFPGA